MGVIRRGLSGDAVDIDWRRQRVLILGHGPFATENARTALEHGASHVTFGVRRHGIVCPELVDYVNYIREYDAEFGHPASGSAQIVSMWRQLYGASGAIPPECWAEGRFLPDGHTVSISDLYFIAHNAGLLQSIVGIANRFSETGVVLSGERHVEASIVIKAVGFELNEGNERLVGRSRLHGGRIVDEGLWTIFESHPDGNFSNSAFGSCAHSGLEHRTLGSILHSVAHLD